VTEDMILATDKKKASVYMEEALKADLEKLAKARRRSVSSLIEILCDDAVKAAKKSGEIE
jgi:hypothetical protein